MKFDIIIGSNLTCWQQPYLYDAGARKRKDLEENFCIILVGTECVYAFLVEEWCGNGI